jgi:hypothetical protein
MSNLPSIGSRRLYFLNARTLSLRKVQRRVEIFFFDLFCDSNFYSLACYKDVFFSTLSDK